MEVGYGYLKRQYTTDKAEKIWQDYVKPVVARGDFTLGKEVTMFEEAFAASLKSRYAIGVANGTDALWISLKALGIGEGDEVIVPVNTFIASVAAIAVVGATPVFVDSGSNFVIDPDKIEDAITEKTKAIMPVHFQGQPCDMSKIMRIAYDNDLRVVEDAAQAANAMYMGQYCGTFGDLAGISFHPQKNMNCWGDGGCILTQSEELYEKIRLMRNHGMRDRDHYAFFAWNSRLDTTNAAVLLHDLPDLPASNNRRIDIAEQYDEAFNDCSGTYPPERSHLERHTYHLYMMEVDYRGDLLNYCCKHGVEANVHYPIPLHLQECSQHLGYKEGDFPVAEEQARTMISLPIHPYMTSFEVDYVMKTVRSYYGE